MRFSFSVLLLTNGIALAMATTASHAHAGETVGKKGGSISGHINPKDPWLDENDEYDSLKMQKRLEVRIEAIPDSAEKKKALSKALDTYRNKGGCRSAFDMNEEVFKKAPLPNMCSKLFDTPAAAKAEVQNVANLCKSACDSLGAQQAKLKLRDKLNAEHFELEIPHYKSYLGNKWNRFEFDKKIIRKHQNLDQLMREFQELMPKGEMLFSGESTHKMSGKNDVYAAAEAAAKASADADAKKATEKRKFKDLKALTVAEVDACKKACEFAKTKAAGDIDGEIIDALGGIYGESL